MGYKISKFWMKLNQHFHAQSNALGSWASLITIISMPLILIGLFLSYFQVRDVLISPDPQLEFVHSSSVAYMIANRSGKLAEDVLVAFGLFDLDVLNSGPVPIPSVNYEYVNKESEIGPFAWFSNFAIQGHRYFGIVYVGCRGGKKLRTYWIYVKHGFPDEGFYAERQQDEPFEVTPGRVLSEPEYLEVLFPKNRRHLIE